MTTRLLFLPITLVAFVFACGAEGASDRDGAAGSGAAGNGGNGASGATGGAGGTGGGGSGGSGGTGAGGGSYRITIERNAFDPVNLIAPRGAIIEVVIVDEGAHSVTSQSEPGNYYPGEVDVVGFDTERFTGPDTRTFTLPDDALPGTVIPYYCRVEAGRMENALENRITIRE